MTFKICRIFSKNYIFSKIQEPNEFIFINLETKKIKLKDHTHIFIKI